MVCETLPRVTGAWPDIANAGAMLLGARCLFNSFRLPSTITVLAGAELRLGACSFVNDGVNLCASVSIHIGHHTKLGDMTTVYDTDFHAVAPGEPVRRAPVRIGDNVWIGAGVIILPGVTIGDHAVVAAGSVVTGAVPPCSLVAGHPARVVRTFQVPEGWLRD